MNRFVLAKGSGRRIPLTIVGGPKGAGKTTLLRQLVTCNDRRRIAVLLDHPHSLSLGGSHVVEARANSLSLSNGSSCLALDGDIGAALSTLHTTRDRTLPDHIVVEAGASVDPLRSAGYTFLPGFRPGGMVVVVSAPEMNAMREEGAEPDNIFAAQLQHAELLVVNQMDGLKLAARPAVRRWLGQRTGRARLIESEHCCIPTAMILGAGIDQLPVHAIHAEWSSAFSVDTEARRNRVAQPRHADDYRAWLLTTESSVDSRSFRSWANGLPDGILRGEGVLRITGERSHRFHFDRCGMRWTLSRDEPWGDTSMSPVSWISLVGFASSSMQSTKPPLELQEERSSLQLGNAPHFRPPLRRSPSRRSPEGLA